MTVHRHGTSRSERVARARGLRDQGLLLREIAAEMGVAVQTVHAWLSDPDGSRQRARKDSYRGECDTCGGTTDGSNGTDKAPTRCMECLKWTPEAILEALRDWGEDSGGIPPREVDCRIGYEGHGRLPAETTVKRYFGRWNAALAAAGYGRPNQDRWPETTQAMADAIRRGLSTEEVGEMFGISANGVSMRLRNHGMRVSDLRRAA